MSVILPGDRIAMFGAGGHARSLADVVRRCGARVELVVGAPTSHWDCDVVESDDEGMGRARRAGLTAVVGLGGNAGRLDLARRLLSASIDLPALVASTATVADPRALGPGAAILEHAHVGPGSTIGTAALLNTAAVVEHDCAVGDGAHVAPGAVLAGHVVCGARSMVGARAVVLVGLRMGNDCRVGAGATVTKDVETGDTVVGIPARVMETS